MEHPQAPRFALRHPHQGDTSSGPGKPVPRMFPLGLLRGHSMRVKRDAMDL